MDIATIHSQLDRAAYELLLCNLLFVQEKAQQLLELSQTLLHTPLQPLVEGSYWSLVGQHSKSVLCFSAAVARSPACYDGWLLLGHEYMSLAQQKAAIACYFKAVQINSSDYRGFFALAQAYAQGLNDDMAYYFFMRTVSLQ